MRRSPATIAALCGARGRLSWGGGRREARAQGAPAHQARPRPRKVRADGYPGLVVRVQEAARVAPHALAAAQQPELADGLRQGGEGASERRRRRNLERK